MQTRFGREGVQVQTLAVSLGSNCVSPGGLFVAAFVGLAITGLSVAITGYDTSASFRPVRLIATASQTRHATNHISSSAVSLQVTALPVTVLAAGMWIAYSVGGGLYGVALAAAAMLSMAGVVVAVDSYGPITDNAGGIAEVSELPYEVRTFTDARDAVGNTTKAVTNGYGIGSAATTTSMGCLLRVRSALSPRWSSS